MKNIGIALSLFFPVLAAAQNVGIGTVTPSQKLEVRNALRSTVKISSASFTDTSELQLSNRNLSNQGTDFSLKNIREDGLYISSASDLPQNSSANSLVIKPYGFIGINDPAPSARLTIAGSETTASGQAAAIRLQNTASSNTWYLRAGAAGTTTPDGGFSIADNSGYHFNMDQFGNLGLGIIPVAARLHVNGGVKIQGTNILEMGAGVAGKETNAGKIGYNIFGTNALTFTGAGTSLANRAVYFFAEGGTTFNGPVNLEAPLRVNGNAGTARQVLTSNGAADPTWEDAAYSNNVRFAFGISTNASAPTGNARFSTTHYNLSPSEVTVATDEITISRAGLYHLDFFLSGETTFASAPASPPRLYFSFQCGFTPMLLVNSKVLDAASTTYFKMVESYSMNVYLPAGTVLRLFHSFSSSGTSYFVNGHLLGHLISE